jgi:hypothetical protein
LVDVWEHVALALGCLVAVVGQLVEVVLHIVTSLLRGKSG